MVVALLAVDAAHTRAAPSMLHVADVTAASTLGEPCRRESGCEGGKSEGNRQEG